MLKNVDENALTCRLRQSYPSMGETWSHEHARYIMETTDPRLETDVADWAAGRPINDTHFRAVDGNDYGIARIMATWHNEDFVGALQIMNLFFRNEKRAINSIQRFVL